MTFSCLPNNTFPLPASIAPKLVALGLDEKTTAKVSRVYLSSALTLRGMLETEYLNACNALLAVSDSRGYSSKELRAKLLTVSITRYMQALSKCLDETIEKAEASLHRRDAQHIPQTKVGYTTLSPMPRDKDAFWDSVRSSRPCKFDTTSPPHAFPRAYPPPVRPGPVSFVTHISPFERESVREPKVTSDCDLDACTVAFARLSLGSPPPSQASRKLSKSALKPPSRTRTTSNLKPTSQLSPSRPRLVSPTLDTSVAVSHKPLPEPIQSYPSLTDTPRTQNIDIPRSNRRKVCCIPYQRLTIHPPSSPESPSSSSFPRSIRRTPSLISDHGSEASSPSTPPDFPSIPIPTTVITRKSSFPEAMSPFGFSPVDYSGGQGTHSRTNVYG